MDSPTLTQDDNYLQATTRFQIPIQGPLQRMPPPSIPTSTSPFLQPTQTPDIVSMSSLPRQPPHATAQEEPIRSQISTDYLTTKTENKTPLQPQPTTLYSYTTQQPTSAYTSDIYYDIDVSQQGGNTSSQSHISVPSVSNVRLTTKPNSGQSSDRSTEAGDEILTQLENKEGGEKKSKKLRWIIVAVILGLFLFLIGLGIGIAIGYGIFVPGSFINSHRY